MRNILSKQIPEMSLSEDKTANVCRQQRDPDLAYMKLPARKQKMATAGGSAKTIRLSSGRQQMEKPSPTAGASEERTRLPGARQQQSRNPAQDHQQLQLQLQLHRQGVMAQVVKVKSLRER